MICKRCGSALPSNGVVCLQCGAMMSKDQIDEQKKWKELNKENNKIQAKLISSKYGVNKENFKYNNGEKKENKLLGLLIVACIFFIILIIALVKFFG